MTSIFLENFEGSDAPERPPSAEFLRGFEAGKAEALQDLNARHVTALEGVSATLSDLTFGYEEARQHIIQSLIPILNQVADKIVPTVLRETFFLHLLDVFETTYSGLKNQSIVVRVAPETHDHLLASDLRVPPQFKLLEDASLAMGQSIIEANNELALMDLNTLENDLQHALTAIACPERNTENG